jgi:GNAT superfamily N-acetyltransferase
MNDSFRDHFSYRALTTDETRHLHRMARERGEWLFTLLARLEGEPIGFLLGGDDPAVIRRRGTLGRLHVLGVLKQLCNRGIARALLIAGMERLKGRGMTEAELALTQETLPSRCNSTNCWGSRPLAAGSRRPAT